jgi:trehalose 6-phosphate synthase/phosphatase
MIDNEYGYFNSKFQEYLRVDLIEKYRKASSRLVLLDYDGTLVSFASLPEKAIPSNHLLDILIKISSTPQTRVIIITGRSYKDIDKLTGHLSIDIVAEHGAVIKEKGKWENQLNEECLWKESVISLLKSFSLRCPGSFVEEKQFSVAWHYRNCAQVSGNKYSRELIGLLEEFGQGRDLKVFDGNMVVEILPGKIGKGEVIKKIIEQNNYGCILSIGDDKTDEEMFSFLSDNVNAVTIKVGEGSTVASYRVKDEIEVVKLLEQISICV